VSSSLRRRGRAVWPPCARLQSKSGSSRRASGGRLGRIRRRDGGGYRRRLRGQARRPFSVQAPARRRHALHLLRRLPRPPRPAQRYVSGKGELAIPFEPLLAVPWLDIFFWLVVQPADVYAALDTAEDGRDRGADRLAPAAPLRRRPDDARAAVPAAGAGRRIWRAAAVDRAATPINCARRRRAPRFVHQVHRVVSRDLRRAAGPADDPARPRRLQPPAPPVLPQPQVRPPVRVRRGRPLLLFFVLLFFVFLFVLLLFVVLFVLCCVVVGQAACCRRDAG